MQINEGFNTAPQEQEETLLSINCMKMIHG